ncbi:pilus assembly protein TadG-related protein [Streptomyces sp. NPDC001680]
MPPHRDTGQAFPIYITVVAGLLFLALAYLAVGQAAVNRSGAQTAADAAALAAAQKRRGDLAGQWLVVLKDPAKWQDIFDGKVDFGPSCWRADELAAQNDGHVEACDDSQALKITVSVKTDKRVGNSVVPGVQDKQSVAQATAVIEPLCIKPPDAGAKGADLPPLTCKGKVWHLKPDDTTGLPKPEDLFDVHLADSPANDQ